MLGLGAAGGWLARGLATLSCDARTSAPGLDTRDGVGRAEAQWIAEGLFERLVGCGQHGSPRLNAGHWEFDTHLGYGGTPGPPLRIDARSGAIAWGDACDVPDPRAVLSGTRHQFSCEVPRS